MTEEKKLCSVCGERDPYPRWICMRRHVGIAKKGEPCGYSLDGMDRTKAAIEFSSALTLQTEKQP